MVEVLNYAIKLNSTINNLKILSFQLFKALDSTCSRLHQRLQKSAITSRHDLKSIDKGNPYLGPLNSLRGQCDHFQMSSQNRGRENYKKVIAHM